MTIPQTYRRSPNAIASYSFTELVSNQGIGIFYLTNALDTTGTQKNAITTSIINSNTKNPKVSAGDDNNANFDFRGDEDYDILANTPLIINGKVLISAMLTTGGTVDNFRPKWIIKLRKWDGTTETELGQAEFTEPSQVASISKRKSFVIDIDNKRIGKGEVIRITVETYAAQSASTLSTIGYYTDPASRTRITADFGSVTANGDKIQYGERTDFKILIPFKIDI